MAISYSNSIESSQFLQPPKLGHKNQYLSESLLEYVYSRIWYEISHLKY